MPVKLNEREYRNLINFRALEEDEDNKDNAYIVEGYAAVFDEVYTLYEDSYFKLDEVVLREAFDDVDLTDVIFQYDHAGRVFARTSNDTLTLEVDDKGLKIRAYLGGTEEGRNLYEEIKGGYTTKMSWGFSLDRNMDIERLESYNKETDKYYELQKIKGVTKIYDVSAVSLPANNATEISARNLAAGEAERIKAERQERLNIDKQKLILKLDLEV
jgi:HK97 family phage prohead protease